MEKISDEEKIIVDRVLLKKADPKASVWINAADGVAERIGITTDSTLAGRKAVILGKPLNCCILRGYECCGYIEYVEDDSQSS